MKGKRHTPEQVIKNIAFRDDSVVHITARLRAQRGRSR